MSAEVTLGKRKRERNTERLRRRSVLYKLPVAVGVRGGG